MTVKIFEASFWIFRILMLYLNRPFGKIHQNQNSFATSHIKNSTNQGFIKVEST